MTENEAVYVLEMNRPFAYSELQKALDVAIDNLEEIQQYRAIGTIEECKALKEKNEPKKPDYPPINESSYVAGWNACIDEILKGSEENEIK